jgi:hypothetical protein
MVLAVRLRRLETALFANGEPRRRGFEQFITDHVALSIWLEERGYPDHLAALEAGEVGPSGLTDLLHEQAAYDLRRRAGARIEAALAAGQLPDEADLRLWTNNR